LASFILELIASLIRCFTDCSPDRRLGAFSHWCYVGFIASIMFSISLVPFTGLDGAIHVPLPAPVRSLHALSDRYQLTHSYGLFRRMTGIGGRPEVIMEGAAVDGPWQEIHFLAKPGKLDKAPPVVLPHQPRLDWQMWFAALGPVESSPWFYSLTHKLLVNSSDVLNLLDKPNYPFLQKSPAFIRAKLYKYHYTKPGKGGKLPHEWWRRDFQQDFMKPMSLNDGGLLKYLRSNGMIIDRGSRIRSTKSMVTVFLRRLRAYTNGMSHTGFVWSLAGINLFTLLMVKVLGSKI